MLKKLTIGIDVTKYFCQITIFDPFHNQINETFKIPNTKEGLDSLLIIRLFKN